MFTFPHYYPSGGWDDLVGYADTLEEAGQLAEASKGVRRSYQIVDSSTGLVVEHGGLSATGKRTPL